MSEERGPSPELGGTSDSYEVERASATPLAAFEEEAAEEMEAAPAGPPMRGPLPEMLAWFLEGVMNTPAADPPIGAMLTRGPKLSAAKRLALYQFAYRARLVECLADDYPAVQYAAGHAVFESLVHRYIEKFPSRAASLNDYGRHFPEFVRSEGKIFFSDLARLEWAMVEVVHAAPSPVLAMTMLQELPPEAWEGIRFYPAPPLRFLQFSHPVNKFLRAFKYDQAPERPEAEWSATAIYRKEFTVWRMDFTPPMAGVLSALLARKTLGEALSTLPEEGAEELANDVMIWFREWVSGGFFERLDLGRDH